MLPCLRASDADHRAAGTSGRRRASAGGASPGARRAGRPRSSASPAAGCPSGWRPPAPRPRPARGACRWSPPGTTPVQRAQRGQQHAVGEVGVEPEVVDGVVALEAAPQERQRRGQRLLPGRRLGLGRLGVRRRCRLGRPSDADRPGPVAAGAPSRHRVRSPASSARSGITRASDSAGPPCSGGTGRRAACRAVLRSEAAGRRGVIAEPGRRPARRARSTRRARGRAPGAARGHARSRRRLARWSSAG